ncbi:MAG: lactococcin 972 family bacteriocin [Acutalibacteraceae bacterium]|nr:lactococcin 972 family bacteriocin [Clostridiales bacterium]
MRKRVVSLILTIVMILSLGAISASALNTERPNGGTWNWGSEGSYAISNYYLEASKQYNTNGKHSSAVIGKTTHKTGWVNSGVWSRAKIAKSWCHIERCYYNAQDYNGTPKA